MDPNPGHYHLQPACVSTTKPQEAKQMVVSNQMTSKPHSRCLDLQDRVSTLAQKKINRIGPSNSFELCSPLLRGSTFLRLSLCRGFQNPFKSKFRPSDSFYQIEHHPTNLTLSDHMNSDLRLFRQNQILINPGNFGAWEKISRLFITVGWFYNTVKNIT